MKIVEEIYAVVLQNSNLHVRLPSEGHGNVITAEGREDDISDTAIVIHNCNIIPTPDLAKKPDVKTYLGRLWKKFLRTIIMKSYLDGFIDREEIPKSVALPSSPRHPDIPLNSILHRRHQAASLLSR
ncbi:hypothetical protein EZV62_016999 [Acer yangbiense]|uniref:Pectinesterase catalytic domain-containing protein n=1 Tax=Acer yangbiense TaxID=1000413 RepID=A0A5C7HQ48_9ROSI|nr:hypothetical protein EZV62_016999 [Acer yangbiense]